MQKKKYILLFFFLFSLSAHAQIDKGNITVGYWILNDTTGTQFIDYNPWFYGRINFTSSGGVESCGESPPLISSYTSNSVCFNGTSSQSTLSSPSFAAASMYDEGTIAFWARINKSDDTSDEVVSMGGGYWFVRHTTLGGAPSGGLKLSEDTTGVDFLSTSQKVSLGDWVHYTYTWRGSIANVSVNGQFNNTISTFNNQSVFNTTFHLGADQSGTAHFLNGSISDLLILNASISQTDINTIYTIGARLWLDPIDTNVTWWNFTTYNNTNYTRTIGYNVTTNCGSNGESSMLHLFQNDTLKKTKPFTCLGDQTLVNDTYELDEEHLLSFFVRVNNSNTSSFSDSTTTNFVGDISNPVISDLNITISSPIFNEGSRQPLDLRMVCDDSVLLNVTYNMTYNGSNFKFGNFSSGSTQTNTTQPFDGNTLFIGECSDLFGTGRRVENVTTFAKNLIFIDEQTGSLFDRTKVDSFTIFLDDNGTSFDVKGAGRGDINFSGDPSMGKLRVEYKYLDDSIITRYIDASLLDNKDVRICANEQNETHKEQFIISSSGTASIVNSVFADCLVSADFARFAFENSRYVLAYTINTQYDLFIFVNGVKTFLTNFDGSISQTLDLDAVESSINKVSVAIAVDGLTISRSLNSSDEPITDEFLIKYINNRLDNTQADLDIKRLDTQEIVFRKTQIANPNNFTLVFSSASLDNVTNQTVFMVRMNRTNEEGLKLLTRYFTINGNTGFINSVLASVIACAILLLTFFSIISRDTFGVFGILGSLGTIVFLSFAVQTWYVLFIQGISAILLVYTITQLVQGGSPSVA